jgi:hypothetical protein
MFLFCQTHIKRTESPSTGAELLHLCDILVVSDELFKKEANVMCNDGIELLNALSSDTLVILDNTIDMVTADTYLVKDQFKEELQKSQ